MLRRIKTMGMVKRIRVMTYRLRVPIDLQERKRWTAADSVRAKPDARLSPRNPPT
jgi:hypothetical protein